jgi:hypothetical protein
MLPAQVSDATNSPALRERRPQWAIRALLVAWGSALASVALTWVQAYWYAFHPHYLPLLLLFTVLASATEVAVALGLWRMVRGPARLRSLALTVVALLPTLFWVFVGLSARANWSERRVPNTLAMQLGKAMGATFMRLDIDLTYPNRRETDRLMMCFGNLPGPEYDLAAMDEYLAGLERLLGGPIKSKVFWVRGELPRLGIRWLSVHGISFGSHERREGSDWKDEGGRGDRHELAHAALDYFRTPGCDPPFFLHEGWAVSRAEERGASALAHDALKCRSQNPSITLRDLFSPPWYHSVHGIVYPIGGAFVEFVIRTRGVDSFVRFYNECRPNNFDTLCRNLFGVGIDDLDKEFWQDAEHQANG